MLRLRLGAVEKGMFAIAGVIDQLIRDDDDSGYGLGRDTADGRRGDDCFGA